MKMQRKRKIPLRLVKISANTLPYCQKLFYVCLVSFLLGKPQVLLAQQFSGSVEDIWKVYALPLPVEPAVTSRIQTGDTLTLPFWDDFSYADSGTPANNSYSPTSRLWSEGSQTVRVNTGLDVAPPSIGVATFDGVDADGTPYSNIDTDVGLADSLISKPIDLSVIPVAERTTVWFSFFWQQFGKGEFPDPEDSIRLQFKNAQQIWVTVWSRQGGDTLNTDVFQQEMIQLLNPGYFHNAFQFRFQSFNRLSGAFDTWNVDYIYLNSERTAANTAYLDRALTSLPTSVLGDYSAVPMSQFRNDPERYVGVSNVGFYNLNVQLQPVRFSALISDGETGELVQLLNNDQALSPIPSGFDRRTISASAFNPDLIDTSLDSLRLTTEFHITSGDNFLIDEINGQDTLFFRDVDYRVNDTVRSTSVLDDYFAYDDGEAEFGVELNLSGGKVAYQFEAPQPDILTHLDIYFPPLTRNQQSVPIRLLIWDSLADSLGNEIVLRAEQAQASSSGFLDEFTRFELSSPVVVEDTFFIGYEQQGETFIAVGLDKNNDRSDRIFYNVTGAWDQNEDLSGSLMMRPVFDRERKDVVLSTEDAISDEVPWLIYPNPTSGMIRINQDIDGFRITDLSGRLLQSSNNQVRAESSVELSLPAGIYIITLFRKNDQLNRKLIVR